MKKNKTFEARLEKGALLDVPVYESHRRGRNWLARIEKDPASPGGLRREFAPRARGEYYYFLPDHWGAGTPVEFGADYYTRSGKPSRKRWYGYILERSADRVVFVHCETASQAIEK